MPEFIYAVLDASNVVTNIVTADSSDSQAMLQRLIPEAATIVLTTEETGPACIGGDILDGRFRWARPFASWVWNSEAWVWSAPIPYPEGGNGYTWDEETVSWVEIPPMEPAPPVE